MALELINGDELMERGVSDVSELRPVLAAHENGRLATQATLRHDEWVTVDDRVNGVMRERLTIVDDMRARGLVQPVSLGTIIRITERHGDFDPAEISFDGDTAPREDKVTFLKDARPVPVIAKDFKIGWRQLDSSRMRGDPLDLTSAEIAARKVRDRLEDLVTNGLAVGGPEGGGIPGLITAPNRLTMDLANNWGTGAADEIGNVLAMLDMAYQSNLPGPFVLYVPKGYWATVQQDYETSGGAVINRTMMERMLAFSDLEAIRPLAALPANNVVLVQMTREVLDLSEAVAVTTVQWEKNPFVTNFRVLTVAGPQIKSIETDLGTTINGIVHLRPAA